MFRTIFILLIILFLTACGTNENTLAEVGSEAINRDAYVERLKEIRKTLDLPDNGVVRKNILNEMVNERILIQLAAQRGLDKDSLAQFSKEKIEIQSLLDSWTAEKILQKVAYSDAQLKEYFIKNSLKMRARHLWAATQEEANILYSKLQKGATFKQLAQTVFQDEALKNSGGDLGFFTIDQMEIAFGDAAYALKVGEISKPVKIHNGYSIIKMEEKQNNPLLTEAEFNKVRATLADKYYRRLKKRAVKNYSDSLAHALQININKTTAAHLYNQFVSVAKSAKPEQAITSNLKDTDVLAETAEGSLDIATFRATAQFTSAQQRAWVKNKEALNNFIHGIISRRAILAKAKKAGMHKTEAFEQSVIKDFDAFLLERMVKELTINMPYTEADLSQQYRADSVRYTIPEMVKLREIILDRDSQAKKVETGLKNGVAFKKLAHAFSIDRASADVGGETNYVTKAQLGRLGQTIFNLGVGQWSGPWEQEDHFLFLYVMDKKPASRMPLNDVKQDVIARFKAKEIENVVNQEIGKFKKEYHVELFHKRLLKVNYSQ